MDLYLSKIIQKTVIPKVFQELLLGCVKAPAPQVPEVGPYLEHWTHFGNLGPGALTHLRSNF